MIPAGIKRDKVIAEMRGEYKCRYYLVLDGLPPQANIANMCERNSICWPTHCNESSCLIWELKPYSTDIATAMALDLPVNHYEIVRRGKKIQALCWITLNPEGIHFLSSWHETEAAAIADARSGAWLEWKGCRGMGRKSESVILESVGSSHKCPYCGIVIML